MISQILLVLVMFSCIGIVALVLMQQSKGDAGSAFGGGGGGGSQSMFGARGAANFLSRATSVLVTVMFLGSLALAYTYSNKHSLEASAQEESVLDKVKEVDTSVPTVPGAPTINDSSSIDVPSVPSEVSNSESEITVEAISSDGSTVISTESVKNAIDEVQSTSNQ